MKIFKTQIFLFVALLLSNAIILFIPPTWNWLRLPTVVSFIFVLPGWAWLPALGWMHTRRAIERIALIFGVSSLLVAVTLYLVVVLPGGFTETPVLIAVNLTIVAGLVCQLFFVQNSRNAAERSALVWPPRTILLILIAIVAVATVTRFTRLGYSEFHGR